MIFWRWPSEIVETIREGFNPGQDHPDISFGKYDGNYAKNPEEIKIVNQEVEKLINNEVFEPLQCPKESEAQVLISPIFVIEKKNTDGESKKYRMLADQKQSGTNQRCARRPA